MYVAPFYEAHRRKNKYFYGIKHGKLRGGSWAIEILVPGRRTIHSTNRRLHEEGEATSRGLWITPMPPKLNCRSQLLCIVGEALSNHRSPKRLAVDDGPLLTDTRATG